MKINKLKVAISEKETNIICNKICKNGLNLAVTYESGLCLMLITRYIYYRIRLLKKYKMLIAFTQLMFFSKVRNLSILYTASHISRTMSDKNNLYV